ncbi:hypothetical protein DL768_011815 [Monosporascus sp. mg162]|nr:hypothetical protein DL768_011815 [Monosporascus sp. mg162]
MRNPFSTKLVAPSEAPEAEPDGRSPADKEAGVTQEPVGDHQDDHRNDSDDDAIDKNAQAGVQKIEAITKVWSRNHLIMAYVFIWVIYFIDAMEQGMGSFLTPYVTSSFNQHSLTSTTNVMAQIIGGVSKLTLAKILDIWGRPQGFLLSGMILTIGLIMMAACVNVEMYAAAQVFYWVGYNGIGYAMTIFIADTSHLKNRGLMLGFISSPFIITTWISSPLAEHVINGIGWRWGYGVFAIVTPLMCLPLFYLFTSNYVKAKKMGLVIPRKSGRTTWQSIQHYFWEFDVICLLLVMGGFALFLLPFNIYSFQAEGWRSPLVICLIIIGSLMLIGAALWEKYFAPVKFLPWELLTDRTVIGGCVLAAALFVEFYLWSGYFTSFMQVPLNLSITKSGYISNIYTIGSCFSSIIFGLLIRWTGRFKWTALYMGVPLTILGVGLMIHFRQPGVNVGYVVMCQIFIAFGGGACVIAEQVAVMAAAAHQHVAVVLAVEGLFANVGGGIGATVATAIWTGVFPKRLAEYLPAEAVDDFANIYGDIVVQLSYPVGSPTRDAINLAYAAAQRYMLISATAVLALCIPAVMLWRNIYLKDFKQVKGRVV